MLLFSSLSCGDLDHSHVQDSNILQPTEYESLVAQIRRQLAMASITGTG